MSTAAQGTAAIQVAARSGGGPGNMARPPGGGIMPPEGTRGLARRVRESYHQIRVSLAGGGPALKGGLPAERLRLEVQGFKMQTKHRHSDIATAAEARKCLRYPLLCKLCREQDSNLQGFPLADFKG